jgi:hypothetical protein
MTSYVYEIEPIDHHWECLKTVDQTASELGTGTTVEGFEEKVFMGGISVEEFLAAWNMVQPSEKLRRPPVVFWVPTVHGFQFGFVYKLANNGTTYVHSPVELPHLGEPSHID